MKKSLGQQMYEVLTSNADAQPREWGTKLPPWKDAFECVQELYEKAAKKLYRSWGRKAINEYRNNYK